MLGEVLGPACLVGAAFMFALERLFPGVLNAQRLWRRCVWLLIICRRALALLVLQDVLRHQGRIC